MNVRSRRLVYSQLAAATESARWAHLHGNALDRIVADRNVKRLAKMLDPKGQPTYVPTQWVSAL